MVRKGKRDRKRNQAWLAKRLKITQQRVSALLKREGWRWPKWGWTDAEVDEIRAWHRGLREENPATASDPMAGVAVGGDSVAAAAGEIDDDETDPRELLKRITNPEKRIKLAGVIERAAKCQVDRELLLGGYLKKEDVEARDVRKVQAVRQELSNVRLLALKMEGMDLIERERVLEDWARGVCQKFERGEG